MTARFLDISAPHVQPPHCVAVEFVQTNNNISCCDMLVISLSSTFYTKSEG